MTLHAFGLNCSLKGGDAPSSTQKLLDQLLQALAAHGMEGDSVLDADILILATPIWMGHPSSLAQRVLERMDAFLDEIDDDGVYPTFGRVALAAAVGNEDGAHKVTADLYQGLSDVGFTLPAGSPPYWVGEAMGSTDYLDLTQTPQPLADTLATIARNAAHLAGLLKARPYPRPR